MASFVELSTTLVRFVLVRLFKEAGAVYPPVLAGEDVGEGKEGEDGDEERVKGEAGKKAERKRVRMSEKRLESLDVEGVVRRLETRAGLDDESKRLEDDNDNEKEEETPLVPVVQAADESERVPLLVGSLSSASGAAADSGAGRRLFQDVVVFLSREVARGPLSFLVRAFGGRVGWEATSGSGSPFTVADESITHVLVDRPVLSCERVDTRVYVQPQWVFDCVNAGRLLGLRGYGVGEKLPPHLSPFGGGKEGYVPAGAEVQQTAQTTLEVGGNGEEEDIKGEEDVEEDDEDEEEEEEDEKDLDVSIYVFLGFI
jgi:pescadillo